MRARRLVFVVSSVVVMATAVQAGEFYKWTDAKGTVHYTQNPPPAGQAAKTVYVDDNSPARPMPGLDGQPQTPQQQAQAQADRAILQKRDARAVEQNCTMAQENMVRLEGGKPLARSDSTDVRVLTPEQRDQAVADARRQVRRYCSNGG